MNYIVGYYCVNHSEECYEHCCSLSNTVEYYCEHCCKDYYKTGMRGKQKSIGSLFLQHIIPTSFASLDSQKHDAPLEAEMPSLKHTAWGISTTQ